MLKPRCQNRTEDARGRELPRRKDVDSEGNIYYCVADRTSGEQMLATLQSEGLDSSSLAVDSLFVDATQGDFRLKPSSPRTSGFSGSIIGEEATFPVLASQVGSRLLLKTGFEVGDEPAHPYRDP